jgi:mono/diheme cytochrome c family protein
MTMRRVPSIPAVIVVLCTALLCGCGARKAPVTQTQQPGPPPAIRYEDHLAAGGELPDGAIFANPAAHDPAKVQAGGVLFAAMNCDGCHGGGGSGWVGPSLADGRWRYGGSDGEIFASIYYGRPKGMPAFGGRLGTDGVWTLVSYLQSLTPKADVATESWVTAP